MTQLPHSTAPTSSDRRHANTLGPIAQVLPEALFAISPDGVIEDANVAACELFALSLGTLTGQPFTTLLDSSEQARLGELLREWSTSGTLSPSTVNIIRAGEPAPMRIEGAALTRPSSNIVLRLRPAVEAPVRRDMPARTVVDLEDEVRERRRTEQLLAAQLEILQLIIVDTPLEEVLVELGKLMETHASRESIGSILLLDEDGVHLRHVADNQLPDAYNEAIDGLEIGDGVGSCGTAAFRNEVIIVEDITTDPLWDDFRDLAMQYGLQACWSTPIPSRTGKVLGTVAMYYPAPSLPLSVDKQVVSAVSRLASIAIERDMEDRKVERLLASERRARAEAEAANQAKDEFLALVSHELRNPLNAMLGWTRLLRMEDLDAESRAVGIETIERNAELQGQLIDDVLDFSRATSGQLKLDVEPTNLAELLHAAIESSQPSAEAAGVRLIDDTYADAVSECDPARIAQVVSNLVGNAIKFTPAGGEVRARLTSDLDYATIEIEDTGQGIEPTFLPHVFDAFRQADGSTTRSHSGLGLGLSIVRRLVEMHGGRVKALSDGLGKGATFIVQLPLAGNAVSAASTRDHADVDITGLRILAIDDELDARQLIGTILSRHGAEVVLAASAEEALAELAEAKPPFDLILTDIAMPETDGYDLIIAIRKREAEGTRTPAIALSAHTRAVDRSRAFLAGFNRHLAKPVEPQHLLGVISDLMRSTRNP